MSTAEEPEQGLEIKGEYGGMREGTQTAMPGNRFIRPFSVLLHKL